MEGGYGGDGVEPRREIPCSADGGGAPQSRTAQHIARRHKAGMKSQAVPGAQALARRGEHMDVVAGARGVLPTVEVCGGRTGYDGARGEGQGRGAACKFVVSFEAGVGVYVLSQAYP